MDERVRGVDLPPPGPKLRIARIKTEEKLKCLVLSPAVWCVGTHWIDGHSMRCTRDSGKCLCDDRPLPYRVKGYLYVMEWGTKYNQFVELTPRSIDIILKNADKDKPLRGLSIELHRGAGGPKSRLYVKVLSRMENMQDFPKDQDPNPVLEKLWAYHKAS